MKRLLLLPIGLIPFVAGFGMNYIIAEMNIYGFGFTLISIAFLIAWFFVGFSVAKIKLDFLSVILFSLAIGIVNYVFMLYQMLFMDQWADNIWGIASQLYMLPSLRIISYINFFGIFSHPIGYITGTMFLLFIVFIGGAYYSRKEM